MTVDLRVMVNKAIMDLTKEISEKVSELTSLRKDLARYQKVQGLLDRGARSVRMEANAKARRQLTDWNSVLKRLPGSFGVANVSNLAKTKSRTYTHRILAKWIKQRQVKRVRPGKYQKL